MVRSSLNIVFAGLSLFISNINVAKAETYSCVVYFEHDRTCRYRWYEDLMMNICTGSIVERDKTVVVDAESSSAAGRAAQAIIADEYPKSYYQKGACTMVQPFSAGKPADAHCIERVDMTKGHFNCRVQVPVSIDEFAIDAAVSNQELPEAKMSIE